MKATSRDIIIFFSELRTRLMYVLIFFMLLLAVFLYFANTLYTWLARPLLKFLPDGHLIATQIVSPFFVPFKLAFMAAMMACAPFFLYQVWAFIAPALYAHERGLLWRFIFFSTALFYCGIIFAYSVIFPMLFHFLASVTPVGVALSPDISAYLDFAIKLLLVFGILFEIPMIMAICVYMGLIERQRFIAKRPYAIIGAFILGMLFAPPDVFSQTILAIPIYLLYEIGIFLTKFIPKRHDTITQ